LKPIDIKGRPIYSRVFSILQKYGAVLLDMQWTESFDKPNLFRKDFQGLMVFADMRGTEIISIWDEPYPYLYVFGQNEVDWKKRRSMRNAVEELDRNGVPHRFSFHEEMEPGGLFFGDASELADGKCKMCGTEFDKDGLFCSEKCEKTHLQLQQMRNEIQESRIKCAICGKSLVAYSSDCVLHHIDYNDDKTIQVCRSCHRKIHSRKAKFPDLAPDKPKVDKIEKQEKSDKNILKGFNKQTFPESFDPPSEKFKIAKQKRDKVKHPRY
jgi:hypothetical protein